MQILRDYVPQPGFITYILSKNLSIIQISMKKTVSRNSVNPFSMVLNTNHKGITYHNLTLDKHNYRP